MINVKQKEFILQTLAEYNPKSVGVFGSYARGENTSTSDLDILVDFENSPDLLEIIGIEQKLTEKLGIKVDLITTRSLHPSLKDYVEKDLIALA
ncbi:nucleotidyltransferase family protein [Marivirga salinae]|uniref:Nucleotidyltransferase family protein n=1 Tax=Marivirga salinarum TaxID=3059078 RepID=A0AA49GBB6_9BACT|nr:nucleotidyltransferase family protein [Marivirga sp. BDSF4-3]WKK76939.2 nucleotidyltransferase family protein [Marivirga sp. BDSF4-3]